ncbi:MAG: cytochrome C oxidase subunit IV family protein [Longimicrobiales bacterium]|nr:cytochrome C oxidase subunit IV family protein [Longimicrobiales bacterium]
MESQSANVGLDVEVEESGVEHSDPPYFLVWGILFVLTMAEVGYAFLPLPQFWLAFGLIVMAIWKALLVALYYMHLRFEPRRLWVLVTAPLPLAVILVIAVITEF